MFSKHLGEDSRKKEIETFLSEYFEFKNLTFSKIYFDKLLFDDGHNIFSSTAHIEIVVDGKPYVIAGIGSQAFLIPRFNTSEFKYKLYYMVDYSALVDKGIKDITLPNGRLLLPALVAPCIVSENSDVREVRLVEFKKNDILVEEAVKQVSAYIFENHCSEDFYMTASDKHFREYQKETFKELSVFINSRAFKFILGCLEAFEVIETQKEIELFKAGKTLKVNQTRYTFKYLD